MPDGKWEYMWVNLNQLPARIIEKYNLRALAHKGQVLLEVRKGLYGMRQAGFLAHEKLMKVLGNEGYNTTPHTPCLIRNEERNITSVLVVDDFCVKYTREEDVRHLIDTLERVYTLTTDWQGSQYIGYNIKFDYSAGTVTLSGPENYVRDALASVGYTPRLGTHSPWLHVKPTYGKKGSQSCSADTSAPLNAAETSTLQKIVGKFGYHAQHFDAMLMPAVNKVASLQSKPTVQVREAANRFMDYAATYPHVAIVYYKSEMIFGIHSDASFNSESEARSRIGGFFHLSNAPAPDGSTPVNGPIEVVSTILKHVVTSTAEAEIGAMFVNAQKGVAHRNTLCDLG